MAPSAQGLQQQGGTTPGRQARASLCSAQGGPRAPGDVPGGPRPQGSQAPSCLLHLSPFVFQEKTKYPRYRDHVSPRGICSFKTRMCIPLEGQSSWKIGGSYLHRTSQRDRSVQGACSLHGTPARPGQRPAAPGPCPQPPWARAPPCAPAFQP